MAALYPCIFSPSVHRKPVPSATLSQPEFKPTQNGAQHCKCALINRERIELSLFGCSQQNLSWHELGGGSYISPLMYQTYILD